MASKPKTPAMTEADVQTVAPQPSNGPTAEGEHADAPAAEAIYDPDRTTEAAADVLDIDPKAPTAEEIQSVHARRGATEPSERDKYLADVERIRSMRRQFGRQTQKLALPNRPGYKRYWFNDAPGQVQGALDNGWGHVLDKDRKPLSRVVGSGRDGGALKAYAMEIPQEFWDEDQERVHQAAKARIDAIKAKPIQAAPGTSQKSDTGKFYSPEEGGILQVSETVRRG